MALNLQSRLAASLVCSGLALSTTVGRAESDSQPTIDDRPPPAETESSAELIKRLIGDLDSDTFVTRERASEELTRIGAPAIAQLAQAAERPRAAELTSRAIEILKKLLQVPATKGAAQSALEQLAKSPNALAAGLARKTLESLEKSALPGQLFPPQAVGGRHVSIRSTNVNGHREIDVREDHRHIKIVETPQGTIEVTVTQGVDNQRQTVKYQAQTVDELQQKHPPAFALYKQYASTRGQGPGDANPFFPFAGREFPIGPRWPSPFRGPEQFGPPGALAEMQAAQDELKFATDELAELARAAAPKDQIERATMRIEVARRRLEAAQNRLGRFR